MIDADCEVRTDMATLVQTLKQHPEKRYPRPSIEDIDLGYRIRQAGGQIIQAQVQVKHHKAWALNCLITTDVLDRGIPWTKLLLSNKSSFVNALDLQISSRISVAASYVFVILILASFYKPEISFLALFTATLLLWLNMKIYRFFYRKRGFVFSIRAIFMHWLYYLYSGLAFIGGALLYWQAQLKKEVIVKSF